MTQHIVMPTKLNVRVNSGKDEANTVIGVLPKRTIVEEIDALSDRTWLKIQAGNLTGWVSNFYLMPLFNEVQKPWLNLAYNEFGVAEYAGPILNNSRIEQYHNSIQNNGVTDNVAWCSAFTNWCVEKSGINTQNITRSARSWANYGTQTTMPSLGSIVVFWRRPSSNENPQQNGWSKVQLKNSGSYGHVGFYVEHIENRIMVYGGNQSSSANPQGEVCKKAYPFESDDYGLLCFINP